jgi:hypothetical protein
MMRNSRILHYLLKDKKNYHRDKELSQQWDVYLYLLHQVRQLSWQLIRKKFIYFIKYKKLYLTRVLLILSIFFGSAYFSIKWLVDHNPFFEVKRIAKIATVDTLYCPDTIPLNTYIIRTAHIAETTPEKIQKKVSFIVFYTEDSTKTVKKFLERLGEIESRNDYKSRRVGSQYLGRWQMGDAARKVVGFGNISYDKFLNTPELQDAAVILLLKYNYAYMKPYLNRYNNRIIRGYHLTTSGMLAMAHNVGADEVIKFLNSNCSYVPRDGNGPADRFLILGNYNMKSITNEEEK